MPTKKHLWVRPEAQLKYLGWDWMLDKDTQKYLTDYLLLLQQEQGEAYYQAAQDLQEMIEKTADFVLQNNYLQQCGVPQSLWKIIEYTWNNPKKIALYGRFDLAGGLDGKPIYCIEYNADTPVCLAETAVVQWAQLKANKLDENYQFNTLFEALVEQWKKILDNHPDKIPTLLLSYLEGYPEDRSTVSVLGEAAQQAGFKVSYAYLHETEFGEDGVFTAQEGFFVKHNFWFKLVPWHWIAVDEPELLEILEKIIFNNSTIILNPPYTALLESKALLKLMYDLFPQSPYLLPTSFEPLPFLQVRKPVLGREGANVAICDAQNRILLENKGDYSQMPFVYQKYVDFVNDEQAYYQAGVFVSGEPCGLGFRWGGKIIDGNSRFVGHTFI